MNRPVEDQNRRMLRARDAMDRAYARPLDIAALASIACVSEAHFIRSFRATFGETPHRYLQRRRVERAMFLLRETNRRVTDISLDVGFASLGTFSRTFHEIVGEPPTAYRQRERRRPAGRPPLASSLGGPDPAVLEKPPCGAPTRVASTGTAAVAGPRAKERHRPC